MSDQMEIPASFREAGFFIVPELLSAQSCDTLIEAGEQLGKLRGGDRKSLMNPHRDSEAFLAALANPALLPIVRTVVRGIPMGLQTQFYFHDSGTKGFTAHQDNYFVQAPADAFVSAWISLVDIDRDNGCLMVWPGTNKLGALPVDPAEDPEPGQGQHANARRLATRVPRTIEPVDVVMPRGSVVFMDGWLAHASHGNTSQRMRYALLCTYVRKGAPFRPGEQARRTAVDLACP